MKYYLCLSKIGPATAFTTRDDAERFKVSRLSNEHMEVVEVVTVDELNHLRFMLRQCLEAITEWRESDLLVGTEQLEETIRESLPDTTQKDTP